MAAELTWSCVGTWVGLPTWIVQMDRSLLGCWIVESAGLRTSRSGQDNSLGLRLSGWTKINGSPLIPCLKYATSISRKYLSFPNSFISNCVANFSFRVSFSTSSSLVTIILST
ncbi:hypothetical protein CR513_19269, partial [Mucuna pruriens]